MVAYMLQAMESSPGSALTTSTTFTIAQAPRASRLASRRLRLHHPDKVGALVVPEHKLAAPREVDVGSNRHLHPWA